MSEPFVGQLMQVGFTFAPRGWAECSGSLMSIAQNTALFSLLGTTYGGDGQTTFALPDLRSRTAVGTGTGPGLSTIQLGEVAGAESVTLLSSNVPAHTHTAAFSGTGSSLNAANTKATAATPTAGVFLGRSNDNVGTALPYIYSPTTATAATALGGLNVAGTVTVNPNTGGGVPVGIRNPFLGILHIIALQGIYPSRN